MEEGDGEKWMEGRRRIDGEKWVMIAKDDTSYQLLCLFAFRASPEKQGMEKDLLSSSPMCFQHGDRRHEVVLCPQVHTTLCLQGSVTEMLRLVWVEGDGKCLWVKAPVETLKPGGSGWDVDKRGHRRQ